MRVTIALHFDDGQKIIEWTGDALVPAQWETHYPIALENLQSVGLKGFKYEPQLTEIK